MKRLSLLLMILMAVVVFGWWPMAAGAEMSYIVKKGDCLSKIGKELRMDWQTIAKSNKIGLPYTIRPGQRLILPGSQGRASPKSSEESFSWVNINADPFRGEREKAWKSLGLSELERTELRGKVERKEFSHGLIKKGDKFDAMAFSKNKVRRNVIAGWKNTGQYQAARVYKLSTGREVWQPLVCNNWAVKTAPMLTPTIGETPVELKRETPAAEAPALPSIPEFWEIAKKTGKREHYSLQVGGGLYESDFYDHSGSYNWAKGRIVPFWHDFESATLGIGGFGFLSGGSGEDKKYGYGWQEWAIGPTFKLFGKHWDADIDIGAGQLWNDGQEGFYESGQRDDIFLLSAHLNLYDRRDDKKKWFPKTEFNLEWRAPFHTTQSHSFDGNGLSETSYDNQALEVSVIQHIYDFSLTENSLLTPGIKLAGGHEWGPDDSFVSLTPTLTLSAFNQDIVSIGFLGWKENLERGGQIQRFSGCLDIGGIIRAVKAWQIEKATWEDMTSTSVASPDDVLRVLEGQRKK